MDSPKLVEECISVKLREEVPIVGKKTRYSPPSIAKNRTVDSTAGHVGVNGRYHQITLVTLPTLTEGSNKRSLSCSEVFKIKGMAFRLSKDKMDALETDIFKPLNSCEILLARIKASDYRGITVSSIHELNSL